jgi:hypothetical protein
MDEGEDDDVAESDDREELAKRAAFEGSPLPRTWRVPHCAQVNSNPLRWGEPGRGSYGASIAAWREKPSHQKEVQLIAICAHDARYLVDLCRFVAENGGNQYGQRQLATLAIIHFWSVVERVQEWSKRVKRNSDGYRCADQATQKALLAVLQTHLDNTGALEQTHRIKFFRDKIGAHREVLSLLGYREAWTGLRFSTLEACMRVTVALMESLRQFFEDDVTTFWKLGFEDFESGWTEDTEDTADYPAFFDVAE